MYESILTSIKKMLGIESDCADFDTEIIAHIDSILMALTEMGVVKEYYSVSTDKSLTWNDILNERESLNAIRTYVYMRVRLLFDPPSSQTATESYRNAISEFEWRLYSKTGL